MVIEYYYVRLCEEHYTSTKIWKRWQRKLHFLYEQGACTK